MPTNFRRALSLAIATAVLTSLSFVPYNLYPLGFICFLPLFYLFENFSTSKKQIFWIWLIFIIIFNLIGYRWIMHTIAVYGMMPSAVAFPLFLLYSLGTGGKLLLFFFFLRWMNNRKDIFSTTPRKTLAVTAAFAVCEIIGWQLFPWYGGNIVSGNLPFAQAADLVGTKGLSLLWVALQFLLFEAIGDFRAAQKKSLLVWLKSSRSLQIFIVLFLTIHTYGFLRINQFTSRETNAPKIIVGVPQGNVPLITQYHERPYIIARMVAQTQRLVADAVNAGKKPDLIVWPESSIPAMEFARSPQLQTAIEDLQKNTQTPIIINDILHEAKGNKEYSNMWQLDMQGKPVNNYQKNFLLPFGEFMPLGDTFPALKNLFPAVSDFSHGEKFSLFNIATQQATVKAMPLVCYEIILPDYARGFDDKTNHEAQFIINITNDAWFGDSFESLQHMTLGVMRAIELRLPIVRATNSGISAYISSIGEVSGQTQLFERVNQLYSVPAMQRAQTIFAHAGNLPIYFFILFSAAFIWFRRNRRSVSGRKI